MLRDSKYDHCVRDHEVSWAHVLLALSSVELRRKNSQVLLCSYNTIQYKTCNAPYVTRMQFVGAGDDT